MAIEVIIKRHPNGEEFLELKGHRKNHQYSVKFLEKLTGFKLSEYAGWSLMVYGAIRVTRNSEGSYRKD